MCYHTWYHTCMVKTTLYLPAELNRGVAQLAERRQVSEAEVIRAALSHEVAAELPLPAAPLFHSEELAGARDEELLRESGFGS
jgi:hypothetical protein